MKRRITKSNLTKYARQISPDIIRVKIVKKDDFLILNIKPKSYPKTVESRTIISRSYKSQLDDQTYEEIIGEIKNQILQSIIDFGKRETDFLISKFDLSSIYKDKYEDKNIMYKVPWEYQRDLGKLRIKKNLSFYYFDEIKVSLPHLFYLWILLVRGRLIHQEIDGIFDIVYSMIERIKQLFFTHDRIKNIISETKHFGNPDSFFAFYYHFTYFVSLVKAIGDNLGWILKLYLKLNLTHIDVDLLRKNFRNSLCTNNKAFLDIVYSNNYFNEYKKMNDFRDIIQHRHVIKSMRVLINNNENKILIPNDPERLIDNSLRKIKSKDKWVYLTADPDSAIHYGLHEYFATSKDVIEKEFTDPLKFCENHINGISTLTENVIEMVVDDWTKKYIGEIVYFYPKKLVAVANILDSIKLKDYILIKGKESFFKQRITDLEINHKKVRSCTKSKVGIKVIDKVRNKDKIYLIKKIDHTMFLRHI